MTTSPHLPEVASFWHGSSLSWIEQLCLRSFLDRGHRVTLYAAEPVGAVPEGVALRHPADILWPPPFPIAARDRMAAAIFSDIFRLELLARTDAVWVDLDAYCVRPLDFPSGWIFCATEDGSYPTGILRLPRWSAVLAQMRRFVTATDPSPPWRGRRGRAEDAARRDRGETWSIRDLPWGSSGPRALKHFMSRSAENRHALPSEALYGVTSADLRQLHDPALRPEQIERAGVHSVHIYGRQKKWLLKRNGGLPVPNSYLDRLCRRHGVDPAAAPIPPLDWMKGPAETAESAA